jgi:hypothetical protein
MDEYMESGSVTPETPIQKFSEALYKAVEQEFAQNKATSFGLRITGQVATLSLHISSRHPSETQLEHFNGASSFVSNYLEQNKDQSNDFTIEQETEEDGTFIITITSLA